MKPPPSTQQICFLLALFTSRTSDSSNLRTGTIKYIARQNFYDIKKHGRGCVLADSAIIDGPSPLSYLRVNNTNYLLVLPILIACILFGVGVNPFFITIIYNYVQHKALKLNSGCHTGF